MDKGKIIKYLRNLILFVLLIVLTFWIIFKDQDGAEFVRIIKESNWMYILWGILTMCGFYCLEALSIGRMLKSLGEKSTFLKNLKYALIGQFFNAITPAASGGQPMQIYYMHKDGISIGSSSITLLVNISCVLFVTITLSIFNLFFNFQYMDAGLWTFFIYGTLINSVAIWLFLIAIFSEKTLNKLLRFAKRMIKKFFLSRMQKVKKGILHSKRKLVSRLHERYKKIIKTIDEHGNKYKENAKVIKSHKGILVKNLISYYIQYILFFSVSYFAYLAVPIKEHTHNWFEITSLQSIVFGIVSGIPSPGSVGASEAAYMGLLKNVIPEEFINSVLLLARVMNFYLFVLIAGVVVLFAMMKVSKMNKKDNNDNNKDLAE